MIILGLGNDLVNTNRFKKVLKTNLKFKKRIFTKNEIKYCESKKENHLCYAKRFAAKEAFAKCLGVGISKGINFKDIEVKNNTLGSPKLKISGDTLKITHKILKKKKFKLFLSLSDDKPYAVAVVILTI